MTKIEHNLAKDASQEIEAAFIVQKLTWPARPNGSANLLNPGDTPLVKVRRAIAALIYSSIEKNCLFYRNHSGCGVLFLITCQRACTYLLCDPWHERSKYR